MYYGSLETGRIIAAFERNVPDVYVRDYRDQGGYITLCRRYRDLHWGDQLSTQKVYKQVPAITLMSLPKGNVTSATRYVGLALDRPGWREGFRKAMPHLTEMQMRRITKELAVGEVFPGIH